MRQLFFTLTAAVGLLTFEETRVTGGEPSDEPALRFVMRSEADFLASARRELHHPTGFEIPLPASRDDFDKHDADSLGVLWRTAPLEAVPPDTAKPLWSVVQKSAVMPANLPKYCAIHAVAVSTTNMNVSVEATKLPAESVLGVVLRANRMPVSLTTLPQVQFLFAATSTDEVLVGKYDRGSLTILHRVAVDPADSISLSVTAFDAELRVERNGKLVLAVPAPSAGGAYAGIIGWSGKDGPTRFDNFRARIATGEMNFPAEPTFERILVRPDVWHRPTYFAQQCLECRGIPCFRMIEAPISHAAFFAESTLFPLHLVLKPMICPMQTHECFRNFLP